MTEQTISKPKQRRRSSAKRSKPWDHQEDHDGSDNEEVEDLQKDSDEEELDRLVLGDDAGFLEQLGADTRMSDGGYESSREEAELEEEGGLEGVDDADLFFLDSGPSAVDLTALVPRANSDNEDGHGAAAWEDSDDDRLTISLAGNTRLRKLRLYDGEDHISGREYTRRLRRQFERLHTVPEWAQATERPAKRRRRSSAGSGSSLSSDDGAMDVDEENLSTLPLARLLQDATALTRASAVSTKRTKLRPEVIDIQRTRDIPGTQPSAVESLSFHPEYPVLLSSGQSSTLYLNQIDPTAHPTPNPLLTSVHIRKTPIQSSGFLGPTGDKIIFSGRRHYFHTWDLPSGTIQKVTRVYGHKEEQRTMERMKLSPDGRYMALAGSSKKGGGLINILDANTTQWVASARIEGRNGIADFAWWSNSGGMTIVGKGSEVGEWSLESRSFIARWIDDGHAPTVMTLGGQHGPSQLGGDRWIAIGSQSGIVNIYDRKTFLSPKNEISVPERPTPKRAFDQLKRATDSLVISGDGQILCMSARHDKDALRLVHLPSCTLYRNWPTSQTPLGRVTAVAFMNGSEVLAIGNDAGKIRLFEIRA